MYVRIAREAASPSSLARWSPARQFSASMRGCAALAVVLACTQSAQAQQQVVPEGVFGRVQGMRFTVGTGEENDVEVACRQELTAAQATVETATGPLAVPGNTAWAYMQAVVQDNQPYNLDGTETQQFIDIYACASTLTVSPGDAPEPPPTATEHGCGGRVNFDYGGNPSYRDGGGNMVECGYAPILAIIASEPDWQPLAWWTGPVERDASMDSGLQCQIHCAALEGCAFYSYEWEYTSGVYAHECYLKSPFGDNEETPDDESVMCMTPTSATEDGYANTNPYQDSTNLRHGESGPRECPVCGAGFDCTTTPSTTLEPAARCELDRACTAAECCTVPSPPTGSSTACMAHFGAFCSLAMMIVAMGQL
jgi:hypothetical protein